MTCATGFCNAIRVLILRREPSPLPVAKPTGFTTVALTALACKIAPICLIPLFGLDTCGCTLFSGNPYNQWWGLIAPELNDHLNGPLGGRKEESLPVGGEENNESLPARAGDLAIACFLSLISSVSIFPRGSST